LITSDRILTAPEGFVPKMILKKGNEELIQALPEDDSFKKTIAYFNECINNQSIRNESYKAIQLQAELLDSFLSLSIEKQNI